MRSIWSAQALLVAATAAADLDFNRDVRPILSDKCFQCHGPDSTHRAADLRLDVEEAAKADLGGYHAVDVRAPANSEMLARIDSDDEYMVMPPPEVHKPLTSEEKETLRRWLEAGAPWSEAWNYVNPEWTDPPDVSEVAWPANWIDAFVLARLEAEGVEHAADSDPVTLIRRVAFDLTGLPPQRALVDSFIADPSEYNYLQIVDQLLASPHFGERMAMYWLDLVRYADTVGYHGDQEMAVWPYRDYVIHAFNTNKPFHEFTEEQLAGDLLPGSDEDDLIASAYNRLLQTSHEGGLQLKEYRAIYLADRVRNVSQVWMGATMGCCQCHDHKFDPLSIEDFYSLGAFFADIEDEKHLRNQYNQARNRNPTLREPQSPVRSVYQRQRLERFEAALADLQGLDALQDANLFVSLQRVRDEVAKPTALVVSRSSAPREVRVLPRGNWQDETGEPVEPRAPEAFGWKPTKGRSSRLDLARWLCDEKEGAGLLTARVMVNRFWYLLFGEGIAPVLDDFGGQGQPPTHPRLLDNLAVDFVESNWDIKRLLRQIVASRTYRQTSDSPAELLARDPYNRLIARQGRYRLSAEMVRDTALSASGLLVTRIGGPSVRPYQPAGYYKNLNFPKRKYRADTDDRQWRRGVYVHWQRQYLHPMLKAFDAPSREECTAKRASSSTPLASLVLLNDPTFVEAARVYAANVLANTSSDPAKRLDEVFRRALSREADEFERSTLLDLVSAQHAYFEEHPAQAKALLDVGSKRLHDDIDAPELAAWTFACRAVLNLGETFTRY